MVPVPKAAEIGIRSLVPVSKFYELDVVAGPKLNELDERGMVKIRLGGRGVGLVPARKVYQFEEGCQKVEGTVAAPKVNELDGRGTERY